MNYEKIINKSLGDKWALLLGLMALYGDGEFSQQELEYLRKFLLYEDNKSKKDYLVVDKKFVEKIVNTLEKILKFLENKENNK